MGYMLPPTWKTSIREREKEKKIIPGFYFLSLDPKSPFRANRPSVQSSTGGCYPPTRALIWGQGMAGSRAGEGPGTCLHCWDAHPKQGLGRGESWRNSLQHLMPVDWESNQ